METSRPNTRVGIVGMPPLDIIRQINDKQHTIFDLDEPLVKKGIELASPHLPQVYCAILRTAVVNSLTLVPDIIYIDVGPGKCDCALHTATILKDILPDTTVVETRNQDRLDYGTPLCKAKMNTFQKMERITTTVQSASPYPEREPCRPTVGFWGVPPRDFSILSPFPDTTHIYGWTRCMENKTPDNQQLEKHINQSIPTVFFAQSFCAKTALAKHLANLHPHALYLDCDVSAGSSAKAKIQAFLELSGVTHAAG